MLRFRELESDECRIIGARHGQHTNNAHGQTWLDKFGENGEALTCAGLMFDAAWFSPQQRAAETVIHTLRGAGQTCSLAIDSGLDSLNEVGPEQASQLKARAAELGVRPEELQSQGRWEEEAAQFLSKSRLERGREGARALRDIASLSSGNTYLAGVHTAYRAEVSVLVLQHPMVTVSSQLPDPEWMMEHGSIFELILNLGEFVECRYIPREELLAQ